MNINVIIMVCSITACIFSVLALLLGFTSLLKVMAMEKATHSVQFMPVDTKWSTTDEEVSEINKEFKELHEDIVGL
jgi:signal transduction histidine kinase